MSTTKRSMQEAKRLIGGQMLLDGFDVPEVIDVLKVVRSTVYEWKKRLYSLFGQVDWRTVKFKI